MCVRERYAYGLPPGVIYACDLMYTVHSKGTAVKPRYVVMQHARGTGVGATPPTLSSLVHLVERACCTLGPDRIVQNLWVCEDRPYKQRATPEEMQRKRLGPKRTRLVSTAQGTELGKRLRENMEEVGRRCKERRGDG